MISKCTKNIEKNKIPNLTYVILQNPKYLIFLSVYRKSGPICCSHFIKCCYGCLYCCRSIHYCWGKSVFLHIPQLSHQETQRKLKSSSSSPKVFCTVLQSSYYFFMTNKEKPCCFSRPKEKMLCPVKVQVWCISSFTTRLWKNMNS